MNTTEFLLGLPSKVDPAALQGLETNFHFIISKKDENIPDEVTIQVRDGSVNAQTGLIGEPKCVVSASDENLSKLLKGELNPIMANLTRKLKISNQVAMWQNAKNIEIM